MIRDSNLFIQHHLSENRALWMGFTLAINEPQRHAHNGIRRAIGRLDSYTRQGWKRIDRYPQVVRVAASLSRIQGNGVFGDRDENKILK